MSEWATLSDEERIAYISEKESLQKLREYKLSLIWKISETENAIDEAFEEIGETEMKLEEVNFLLYIAKLKDFKLKLDKVISERLNETDEKEKEKKLIIIKDYEEQINNLI